MKFNEIAEKICVAVGGSSNVVNVSHCATRLRVTLADNSKVDRDSLEKIEIVKGVIKVGSQYQIIIGDEVNDVYRAFTSNYEVKAVDYKKEKKGFGKVVADVGAYMQSCIGFMLMPLIGCGLLKAVLTILSTAGLVDPANGTYTFLWSCADTVMYYLPVLLAIGGAKALGCSEPMAALLALIPLNSAYNAAVAAGTPLTLFGFNVPLFSFANQYIPAVVTVAIYAYLEKLLKKALPDILQSIVRPALSLIIMIPVIFLVIGPCMNMINALLGIPTNFIVAHKTIFIPVLATIWPILTIFGLQGAAFGLYLASFATFGYDPFGMVSYLCTHLSIGFVALMSAWIAENKKDRETGISTGITMLFGCVSEPALFGVLLRDKRYFLAAEASGFTAGIVAAVLGVKQYTFGGSAYLLGIPFFVGPESSLMAVLAVVATTLVASVGYVLLFTRVLKEN